MRLHWPGHHLHRAIRHRVRVQAQRLPALTDQQRNESLSYREHDLSASQYSLIFAITSYPCDDSIIFFHTIEHMIFSWYITLHVTVVTVF